MFELEFKMGKSKLARDSTKPTKFSGDESLADSLMKSLKKEASKAEYIFPRDRAKSEFSKVTDSHSVKSKENKLLSDIKSQIVNEKFKMIPNVSIDLMNASNSFLEKRQEPNEFVMKLNKTVNEAGVIQKISHRSSASSKSEDPKLDNFNTTYSFYARLLNSLKLNEKQILSESYKEKESKK